MQSSVRAAAPVPSSYKGALGSDDEDEDEDEDDEDSD
jgi:hypothetical protein